MRVFASAFFAMVLGLAAAAESRADIESKTVGPESVETTTDNAGEETGNPSFLLNYTNILYGPSIQNPTSYQPTGDGNPDRSRPVFMKNFLSASYLATENVAVTGTAYWWYQPVLGQSLTIQDPFVRVSHSSIVHTDWGLNWYADARVHFGVTDASRQSDMIGGFQNFNYISWQPDAASRVMLALRASGRYNAFGKKGQGADAEFYLAPEFNYRLNPKFALTALYEVGASHQFGDRLSYFTNDGTDFEPGLEWDPTPNLTVNPYLNMLPGGKISLASTSVGMFLSWTFL